MFYSSILIIIIKIQFKKCVFLHGGKLKTGLGKKTLLELTYLNKVDAFSGESGDE